jgi:hypothetical protein
MIMADSFDAAMRTTLRQEDGSPAPVESPEVHTILLAAAPSNETPLMTADAAYRLGLPYTDAEGNYHEARNPSLAEQLGITTTSTRANRKLGGTSASAGSSTSAATNARAFDASGEVERARLDMEERRRRITDNRQLSQVTVANVLGDGAGAPKLLADAI